MKQHNIEPVTEETQLTRRREGVQEWLTICALSRWFVAGEMSVAGITALRWPFISRTVAGQVPQHPEYKPSLPIMEMENVLGVHFCAWYQSDGMSTPETNRIVQPTLNDSSDTSLKCSVKDAEDSSKQYYPVGNSDLMRVGWKS